MPSQKFSLGGNGRTPKTLFPFIVVPLLSIVLIAGLLSIYLLRNAQAAPADPPVSFKGTIPAAVAHSRLIGPADPNQTLSLSIGLNLRNASVLNNYVKDITNRKSVNFHRYLTPAQFQMAFAPSAAAHNALLNYLKSSGFTITHTYNHRMLVAFTGTVAQAEQVFHVTINNYTAPNGRTFYSNANDPLIPSSSIATVQSISGLNNYTRWSHTPVSPRKLASNGTVSPNGSNCPSPGGPGSGYYTPAQMQAAYNLTGLYNKGFRGEGQRVALFELDTYQPSDIAAYQSCFDQGSPTHIRTVVISGHQPPTDAGVFEVELDAELVLSAAPKLSELVIYESSNDTDSAMTSGYNAEWAQIIQDAPLVVSDSWGTCESDTTSQEISLENNFFVTATAQGQNIFVASADSGSSGCYPNGNPATQNSLEPGDPGDQPNVTSVGGTTLSWDGASLNETVWNTPDGASTGGLSLTFPQPSWQSNVPGVQNQYSNGKREAPDVSLNADANVGYLVFCTSIAAGCTNHQWWIAGGTSASAPMWAAFMALTNQESVKSGGFNIGFVNPLLYQLASDPNSYAKDFHDVTAPGNNDFTGQQGGKYPVTAGYDMATGLGSYNATNLAADLVNLALSTSGKRAAPAASTWYFAEGYIGNGFEELFTVQNPDPTNASTFTVTYVFPGAPSKVVTHTVNPSSRMTVSANGDLGVAITAPHVTISAIIQVAQGSPNIVVERPMYFKYVNGGITIQSGTDVIGSTKPATSYYFAEGDSRQSGGHHYWTYITMLNPSSTVQANVTVTYYTGACGGTGPACPTEKFALKPLQRATARPDDTGVNLHQQVAISVTSADNPIVAERPMYVQDTIANAGGTFSGAASVIGATQPGKDWLFAEGYTGGSGGAFQQYFVLANFGGTTANVTIKMEYNGGSTKSVSVTVAPYSQKYVDVNQINVGAPSAAAAAEITSDQLIVAERLLCFHQGSSRNIVGITDALGEVGPASHNVYSFAEGYTGGSGGNFHELLTMQNPTNFKETIAITIFTPSTVFQQQAVLAAHSRTTFGINDILNLIQKGSNSITVQALPDPNNANPVIVVERPMYYTMTLSGVSGIQQGGTDVIGFTG
ncbi:MAG: protease pro-enzyme activation domain-containing protein [Ktedonobacteraceae bacterium]